MGTSHNPTTMTQRAPQLLNVVLAGYIRNLLKPGSNADEPLFLQHRDGRVFCMMPEFVIDWDHLPSLPVNESGKRRKVADIIYVTLDAYATGREPVFDNDMEHFNVTMMIREPPKKMYGRTIYVPYAEMVREALPIELLTAL